MNPNTWERELPRSYEGYESLMDGIKHGFMLINHRVRDVMEVDQENYKSAIDNSIAVEKQILTELNENRYRIVTQKPLITSALGAIVKV